MDVLRLGLLPRDNMLLCQLRHHTAARLGKSPSVHPPRPQGKSALCCWGENWQSMDLSLLIYTPVAAMAL